MWHSGAGPQVNHSSSCLKTIWSFLLMLHSAISQLASTKDSPDNVTFSWPHLFNFASRHNIHTALEPVIINITTENSGAAASENTSYFLFYTRLHVINSVTMSPNGNELSGSGVTIFTRGVKKQCDSVATVTSTLISVNLAPLWLRCIKHGKNTLDCGCCTCKFTQNQINKKSIPKLQ